MNQTTKQIAEVFFGLAVDGPFDYIVPQELQGTIETGMRVSVLFNKKVRMGFVCGFKEKSEFEKLNVIIKILDATPIISENFQSLARQMARYYGCSLGEAIESCLPKVLRKSKPSELIRVEGNPVPSDAKCRKSLIHSLDEVKKWSIVEEKIISTLNAKRSVIILVPEVQQLDVIRGWIPEHLESFVICPDKKATSKKELETFDHIRQESRRIVIGTRSVVFSPLCDLGLIVVFNEENKSYKQEQTPHYHAREVALMRAEIECCEVCLLSSSPSLVSWHMAKGQDWKLYDEVTQLSNELKVVDMTNYNPRKSSLISVPLEKQMQASLADGGRAAIYLNLKRGKTATSDGSEFDEIRQRILERISRDISWKFPTKKWARYDADSKRIPLEASIIVATQSILNLKGKLDVDVVGVINFDVELSHFDYCASEKALSLLIGLRQLAKKVLVVQTKIPDNVCIKTAADLKFSRFYREETKLRKDLELPPFKHLLSLHFRGGDEARVCEYVSDVFKLLDETKPKTMQCFEPQKEHTSKLRKFARYTIMLKAKSVLKMIEFIKKTLKKVKRKSQTIITMEVD